MYLGEKCYWFTNGYEFPSLKKEQRVQENKTKQIWGLFINNKLETIIHEPVLNLKETIQQICRSETFAGDLTDFWVKFSSGSKSRAGENVQVLDTTIELIWELSGIFLLLLECFISVH